MINMMKNEKYHQEYEVGQVISLRWGGAGLDEKVGLLASVSTIPDNIRIDGINIKDGQLRYMVTFQSNNTSKMVDAPWINARKRNSDAPVYTNTMAVRQRLRAGYLWAGNFNEGTAHEKAKIFAGVDFVEKVIVTEAYDSDGRMDDSKHALWIAYNGGDKAVPATTRKGDMFAIQYK